MHEYMFICIYIITIILYYYFLSFSILMVILYSIHVVSILYSTHYIILIYIILCTRLYSTLSWWAHMSDTGSDRVNIWRILKRLDILLYYCCIYTNKSSNCTMLAHLYIAVCIYKCTLVMNIMLLCLLYIQLYTTLRIRIYMLDSQGLAVKGNRSVISYTYTYTYTLILYALIYD